MIDESALVAKLEAVVASELGMDAVKLERDKTAADVGRWDSMAHVRIMIGLEDALEITIDIEETYKLADFGALIDYVAAKLRA